MQIDRLFQIVYILLDKKRVTARELSEIFEVSTRTIYRDVDTLSIAGIPIYTNKGKGGGICLFEDFVIDKTVLSSEEMNEVLMGLEILNATQYTNADSAILKLKTLFNRIEENWIEVDFSHWGSSDFEKKKFEDLKFALNSNTIIELDYCNYRGNNTSRTVYPLKLIFKQKNWYLAAYCTLRNDYRVFKCYRINKLKLTNTAFDRKKYHLNDITFAFKQPTDLINIRIILSAKVKHRIYDEFAASDIIEKEDGNYEITFSTEADEGLYNYLMSFSSDIKRIEPEFVADIIRERLKKMLENFK